MALVVWLEQESFWMKVLYLEREKIGIYDKRNRWCSCVVERFVGRTGERREFCCNWRYCR